MYKKIIKLLVFMMLLSFSLLYRKIAYASTTTKVHLIFNKISYDAGEEIKLTINLENFIKLNETKVIIKCNDNVFVPIKKNERYGQITNNSIYESPIINEYVGGGYLRFQLHKNNLSEGFYSGYKNNVGEFYFETRKKISNIYEYFQNGNFEALTTGINVSLYDIYNQEITTEFKWSERIKVKWDVDKYNIEVYDEIPLFINDIMIINRNENEYDLFFQDEINNKSLGSQIVTVAIYDKVNADYILMSKVVEVVDKTKPIITGSNVVEIDSNKLDNFKVADYFTVKDNYDKLPEIIISYYDGNSKIISSESMFMNYLLTHTHAKILIKAIDNSDNESDEFEIIVNVKDVEAPTIDYTSNIIIKDIETSNFDFNNYVNLKDNYDANPSVIVKYYVGKEEITDIFEALFHGKTVGVKFYAEDKNNNKTPLYEAKIEVIDTTPPLLNDIGNIEMTDQEALKFKLNDLINISDNIDPLPQIICKYFINEKETSSDNFKKGIIRGNKGKFEYYGIDKSGNKTNTYYAEIIVCDVTKPVIKIHNIKDENKYVKLDKIEYEVYDNFDGELSVMVTLNDTEYNGESITTPGAYVLKIMAVDKSGNEETEEIKFEIIKNNVIGCGDDIECYLDNYFGVVVIVGILMGIILTIFIVRVCLWHKKKQIK